MASDEKLMALKKAYADIILNTAKEAAMRIMVSERKTRRFEREVQLGKDEALRMLLRLKQMMDSKIADAEVKSLNQQKKIDELEAQLQEAEDIVKDLREELREVQSELEELQNKQQHWDERLVPTQNGISGQNEFHHTNSVVLRSNELEYVAPADLRNMHEFQTNEGLKFYNATPHMGNFYLGCPDLPSIILRSKEPELYRNGCTQRIRASEGNFLGGELSLSGQLSKGQDEISVQEDVGDREIISAPINRIANSGKVVKKILGVKNRFGSLHPVPSFHTRRKRDTRHRKKSFYSSSSFPNQLPCTDQAPEHSYGTNHPTSLRIDTDFNENPSSASGLSSDQAEPGLETGCCQASENETKLAKSAGVHNAGNEIPGKLVDTMQTTMPIDISVVTDGETDPGEVDISFSFSEPKETDIAKGFHSPPVNERVIRYTFQRKRKRESLCDVKGVVLVENNSSVRHTLKKQSDPVEQAKSDLITESSPGSQISAEVASQLILLSEMMER